MRTLWKNGTFYSMQSPGHFFYSIVTQDGIIEAVNIKEEESFYDRVVDCQGQFVFPGFVDAHLHLLGYGEKLTLPNVSHLSSKEEVLNFVHGCFQGKPLLIQGYREMGITKLDLDIISSSVPIALRHEDYHAATVNSAKLNEINTDSKTGILKEEIANRAIYSFPKYPVDQLVKMIQNAFHQLYSFGLTGGHSDDLFYFNGFHETVKAFELALEKMPFRTHLLMHHETVKDFILSKRPWLDQTSMLQLGAVKMFYDGTLTSKTALMKEKYQDFTHGLRIDEPTVWKQRLKKLRQLNLPVAIHVIGNQGLDEVVDSLIEYPPLKGQHDRIIHASTALETTIKKMAQLPLVLDIQPQFLFSDFPKMNSLFDELPSFIYPWKTYWKNGLLLCGSSDAPVEIPNPLLGMYAAIFRQVHRDTPSINPNEKLSIFEALLLYTQRANIPTYDARRGVLGVGSIADFTLLSHDPYTLNEKTWFDMIVTRTVIDDRIVFDAMVKTHR